MAFDTHGQVARASDLSDDRQAAWRLIERTDEDVPWPRDGDGSGLSGLLPWGQYHRADPQPQGPP